MNKNVIDQKFDSWVDRLVVQAPVLLRIVGIRIAGSRLGWHLCLIMASIRNAIGGLFVHFRSENDMDLFLDDTTEQLQGGLGSLKQFFSRQFEWLIAIDSAGAGLRFYTQLFLIALAGFGCVFSGTWEIAAAAVCILLNWVSTAFELSYKPVTGKIRQVYIAARIIAAMSMLCPVIFYYVHYRDRGVANNMLLQAMMIFMLLTHLVLYAIIILPNRRQPLFLRILSGVLGIMPALLVAATVSFSATQMGSGIEEIVRGIVRILGAILLFLGDRLEALYSLGSMRLPFSVFLLWFNNTFGLLFLVLAAWN
ncbi:MAG: hypothetical protein IJ242_07690 [Clostridia bacterium]|nr:hypothetical protein [Clostridia bacterium]